MVKGLKDHNLIKIYIMKKIITLFAFVSFLAVSSCTTSDDFNEDNDTIGVTYENQNAYNFTINNDYSYSFSFPRRLVESDVVLVYRFDGVDNSGRPVWQSLPETYYFENGTRDFSFKYVFTYDYVNVYLDGNDPGTIPADYRLDQYFRIVVVPSDFAATVDTSNYTEVMNTLKLSENQVKKVKL